MTNTHTQLNSILLIKAMLRPVFKLIKYLMPIGLICGYPIIILCDFLSKL